MPSAAAKRRKAAQKKKNKMVAVEEGVDAPRGVDSLVPEAAAAGVPEGDDDSKTREERDSDSSGETGSPVSQDQHYPFDQGVEECEKGDAGVDPAEPADETVSEAFGDDCVVELEINDGKDGKDCGEKGVDAANGFQNPAGKVIVESKDTELLPVQSDLQGIPDEEANGNTHEGYIDDGVEKVYSGLEDSDSPNPSTKTIGGLDKLSSPFGSQNMVVGYGDALDDGSVEIVNGAKKEDELLEKIIDGQGSGLPVESDNFVEEVKKDLIAELSLPNESTAPVNVLPEATSLEEPPLTNIAELASPLKELDDSGTVLKEQKEGFLSAVHVVSGVDILKLTKNEADSKLLPVGFDETGTPKDGSESFSEDNKGEQMLSSGSLIAKVENGAENGNGAILANNDAASVLEENSVAKLENGSDTSNLPANGDVATLKENEHGDVPTTVADIAQNGNSKEKNDDLEGAHDHIDNQNELPKATRVVRKTSWMGCCGLFDVITGSVR